jgi:hypothetical protein
VASERSTSALFGLIGGLVASIIVALVSTWVAAEANRTEALRQERRTAYADLIARAVSCQSLSTFGFIREPLPRIPSLAEIRELSEEELQRLIDRSNPESAKQELRFALFQECAVPLQTSRANVDLLSDSEQIRDAGHELVIKSIAVADTSESQLERRQEEYITALSRFQVLARDVAIAPIISPLYIQLLGFFLAEFILLAALYWVFTHRGKLRNEPSAMEQEKDSGT